MTLGHQAKMDPSDLILELSILSYLFLLTLMFRLVHVSSFQSMIPRLDSLWALSLEKLLRFNDSNQPKNKHLDDPCSKCSTNDS